MNSPFLKILFVFRKRGRKGERERERNIDLQEKHWWVASRMLPTADLACNPGMCLGIEPVTLWFAGRHSIYWATPARAFLKNVSFLKYLSLERERKEKERKRNINVWLPLMHPLLGTWPATQTCALTGNRTGSPLICRLALNPLSHTSQGYFFFNIPLIITWNYITWYLFSCRFSLSLHWNVVDSMWTRTLLCSLLHPCFIPFFSSLAENWLCCTEPAIERQSLCLISAFLTGRILPRALAMQPLSLTMHTVPDLRDYWYISCYL